MRLLPIVGAFCLILAPYPALAWQPGDDWRDSQCREVRDNSRDNVSVCRGRYIHRGQNLIYLGVYWDDGSEVVGPCSTADRAPIEYIGMSKSEAQSWINAYCR
jgi:hypothetical protein